MAQTKNARYRVHNGVDFDTIHLETSAKQVKMADGSTVENKLTSHLAESAALAEFRMHANQSIPSTDSYQKVVMTRRIREADFIGQLLSAGQKYGTYKVLKDGLYRIDFYCSFMPNANGVRQVIIPGSQFIVGAASGSTPTRIALSSVMRYNADQEFDIYVTQDSGGAIDLDVNNTVLKITKVG